jgi:lysozyme
MELRMSDTKVIDISHWQADPDWHAIEADGVLGVILKATQGDSYVDDTWQDRAVGAIAAGMAVATYHYLEHGDIDAQMTHYIKTTDKVMPLGSRVCIDFEAADCTQSDLETAVSWLQDQRPDLQIAVYSGSSFLTEKLVDKPNEVLGQTSLWVARYSSQTPYFPLKIWPTWSLWQFTDSGSIGNLKPVDCNRFNGSDGALLAWFGPVSGIEPVPPEPAKPPEPAGRVVLLINGDVDITVVVDGAQVYP